MKPEIQCPFAFLALGALFAPPAMLLLAACMSRRQPTAGPTVLPPVTSELTVLRPVTSEPDPLTGTRWRLVATERGDEVIDLPEAVEGIVTFKAGFLGFDAGCNSITGYYRLDGQIIDITFWETTLMLCPTQEAMEAEELFVDAMQTFETYHLDGNRLRIRYDGGVLLLERTGT